MRNKLVIALLLLGACACACGSEDEDETPAVDCQPSVVNSTLAYCKESWAQCADGKTYEVECQGSAGAWVCQCRIDGSQTASEPGTDFCDVEPLDRTARSNKLCGWSIR